ncbi:response regulator transcription factor [Allonocardiopsis opalescens]|uniref:response regulator transcription factor n=1 Tax=Allonocardiopsis opalescens TaxID=1144618 RepID=UPI001FE2E926|nr:response regulator transcription factor [Allonocardiopsis opalescens]
MAGVNAPIRVLVADDDPLVRSALGMMLAAAGDVAVVAEAADGAEAVAAANEHRPGVVLMDIRMPRVDGLAATARLRARPGGPEVIVLTTFDSDDHVLGALRAGASGFLLKHTPPPEILRAIRLVAAGEPMLSPEVLRRMMSLLGTSTGAKGAGARPEDPAARRRTRARAALDSLSPGEREVALLVGQGRTNGEVGTELGVSVATVKAHVSRLLTKLDLNNRVQVALLVHDADLDDGTAAD